MEKIVFEKREVLGKKVKQLLSEGFVPAVTYNSNGDSTNIQIEYSVASKILREATSTTILDAELDGKDIKVIVKEIDINPLTDQIRHLSFFEIDESKEMTFTIPFEIKGIAPAVKNNLGVLVEVLNSVDVRCKLADLIPSIEVDISGLEHPGQSISIDEVNIPEGITLTNEDQENATIVTITEMQEEEIIEEPEEVEGEEVEGEETEGEEVEGEEEATETETETQE